MSSVYEVEHARLGTRFALKVFSRAEKGDSAFLRERFIAEGRLLARLNSPRLVRVHDLLETPDGDPCYVMDLILGADGESKSLEDVRRTGPVTEDDILRWYGDMAEALRVVHASGVVHRDVKLANILVGPDGHAVLADFGISRYLDGPLKRELAVETTFAADATTNTRPVLGTANYLPPELRKGLPAVPASDCYALGVALFRLLTSVWYEPGSNVLDLLAPFSPVWRRIFPALLAENPEDRSMPPVDPPRRRRRWIWAAAIAAVLAAAAAMFFFLNTGPAKPAPLDFDELFGVSEKL
jgi:serine/threonine-protein kinase